jgi:hypothetical protein
VLDLKLSNARYTNKTTSYTNEESLQRRTMVPVTNGSVVVIDNVQALYRLGEVDHEVQQLTAATPSWNDRYVRLVELRSGNASATSYNVSGAIQREIEVREKRLCKRKNNGIG